MKKKKMSNQTSTRQVKRGVSLKAMYTPTPAETSGRNAPKLPGTPVRKR
jgi:hypothetical protein